ncbi:MAG: hypothetical protein QOE45_2896 [Frankiaceae bacterium]|jgi:hypothetical protein|nr:hypothetical protein [Frankiaceae bacterium]
MRRALALLVAAAACLPAVAHAEPPPPSSPDGFLCVTIPAVGVLGHDVTPELTPCIPFP